MSRIVEAIMNVNYWQLVTVAIAALSGLLLYWVGSRTARAWARRTSTSVDDEALQLVRPPSRSLLPLLAVLLTWPFDNEEGLWDGVWHALLVVNIACAGWLLVRLVRAFELATVHHLQTATHDDLLVRSSQTRLRVFANVAIFLVVLATVAATLITFEAVRELGVSLFASAGAAGIIIGFAAQRSISTVVAGLQIALTQPIRVNDVVIVEGEWGRIEEITLTYVVVCVWDERRLVIPINQFIEKPFQNWTRNSSELLGTVYLYTDYTVSVPAVREELRRICEASSLWDGRVCGLVVTDCKPQVLELRALVSAADSGKLWELRCAVREALVDYVQREHSDSLPRYRGELMTGPAPEQSDPPEA